jgi:tripartite-type tricarboxylate transporter receptor subunit TctC
MLKRRELLLAAGAAATMPAAWAQAQGFPNKPIRIIVATIAGSGPDIAVRKMTSGLADILKQPVVVDNKPGGNGIIAANELMKAPRDGYTLLNANIGNALNDILRPQAGPRMHDDLVPVTDLTAAPLMLLVNNNLPVKTAQEFLAYAKANPTALNYGSGGPGSLIQLTGERLKQSTGIEMKEVPYRSFGADIADLVAGHVQVGFTPWSLIEQHIKSGKVRPLAVASDRRVPQAPDIPTFAEAGLTPITATGWNGIFAPAGTPPEVVQALNRAIVAAMGRPDFKDFFSRDGTEIGGKTPEQFAAFIRSEQDKYRQVVIKGNIKVAD